MRHSPSAERTQPASIKPDMILAARGDVTLQRISPGLRPDDFALDVRSGWLVEVLAVDGEKAKVRVSFNLQTWVTLDSIRQGNFVEDSREGKPLTLEAAQRMTQGGVRTTGMTAGEVVRSMQSAFDMVLSDRERAHRTEVEALRTAHREGIEEITVGILAEVLRQPIQ